MIRERYPGIEFKTGSGDEIFNLLSHYQRNILILDDEMGVADSSSSMTDILTRGSHQKNLNVIYFVQNVYNYGKSQRTIFLN